MNEAQPPRVLLVVSGSIAAQKVPQLVCDLQNRSVRLRCILTAQGASFLNEKELAGLLPHAVFTDPWTPAKEKDIEHIALARQCDLVLVAPASANMLAKMTYGLADNLASTVLLATRAPMMVAPAMNTAMWENPATQHNIALLRQRGISIIGPAVGELACGEFGLGRMSDVNVIVENVMTRLQQSTRLKGLKALVTSGPTQEPIDPVRYISNRSSGKQGHAIAAALAQAGAEVTLISGPVHLPDPHGVRVIKVETAQEMFDACQAHLPADIAVCAAAVADWRPLTAAGEKIKKKPGEAPPALQFTENPDILAAIAQGPRRPRLVIGFAAETNDVADNAQRKLQKKGCDWLVANSVAGGDVFGKDNNTVTVYKSDGSAADKLPPQSKEAVAHDLVRMMVNHFTEAKL